MKRDGTVKGEEDRPLRGLKEAFTKIRKNQKLDKDDTEVLRRFIDEFTTVSIHENTVGKKVAQM